MNAFWLLLPFWAVRFVPLMILDRAALRRAAYFAPVQDREKAAYYIYQISQLALFVYSIFLTVKFNFSGWFCLGAVCYLLGLFLCAIAVIHFSSPDEEGLNSQGIYRFSRNPMYVAYFICFLGMALLSQSMILLGIVLVFQISAHWIILAEERWCEEKFGEAYEEYKKKVRRYI